MPQHISSSAAPTNGDHPTNGTPPTATSGSERKSHRPNYIYTFRVSSESDGVTVLAEGPMSDGLLAEVVQEWRRGKALVALGMGQLIHVARRLEGAPEEEAEGLPYALTVVHCKGGTDLLCTYFYKENAPAPPSLKVMRDLLWGCEKYYEVGDAVDASFFNDPRIWKEPFPWQR
jgi:hypothetical protein